MASLLKQKPQATVGSSSCLYLQLANVLRLQQKSSNSSLAGKHFPVNGQTIKVHYTGKPIDLHVFFHSVSRQMPFFRNVHLFRANRFPTGLGRVLNRPKIIAHFQIYKLINCVGIGYIIQGTLAEDGTEFDSSRGRQPYSFVLGAGQVIRCKLTWPGWFFQISVQLG